MLLKNRKHLLFVNMEYTQDEINEPINIDVLMECVPTQLFDISKIRIVYRDFLEPFNIPLEDYDIILISTKISSFNELSMLLDYFKNKIVIVGGILAICAFDSLAILYNNVIFNTGEGETNIKSLLTLAYESSSIEDYKNTIINNKIPNVCFYNNSLNKLYVSKRIVCDLISKNTPRHNKVMDVIAKNGLVRMETSRGCPWNKCSFCIMPWKFCGKKWRAFSKSKIETEICNLIHSGATQIFFTDEDFIGNYEHILSLCSIIIKCTQKLKKSISFGGSTSVWTLLRMGGQLDYCLQLMKKANINFLFMGIESGSDSQLLRYNKGVSSLMNEKIVLKLLQYNFEIDFGFILFDADTTMNELEENLDFINRTGLKKSISRFAKKLRVTPHTKFYEEYSSRNLIISDLNVDELYYDYILCDSNINIIYKYIQKIDSVVLRESYYLQAFIRSTPDSSEKHLARDRLIGLRECEYEFLYRCVEKYKILKSLSEEDVLEIFNDCIKDGGVCNQYK